MVELAGVIDVASPSSFVDSMKTGTLLYFKEIGFVAQAYLEKMKDHTLKYIIMIRGCSQIRSAHSPLFQPMSAFAPPHFALFKTFCPS